MRLAPLMLLAALAPATATGAPGVAVPPVSAEGDVTPVALERIREALALDFRTAEPRFGMDDLTLTVGLAAITGEEDESVSELTDELYTVADRRLYLGKTTGRDRVIGWRAEAEPPELGAREA